jgi:hypothetical protein
VSCTNKINSPQKILIIFILRHFLIHKPLKNFKLSKLSNSSLHSSIDAINFYHDTYPNQLPKLKLWTPECHTAFHAISHCYSRMHFCNMIISVTSIVMRVTFSLVLIYSPMECTFKLRELCVDISSLKIIIYDFITLKEKPNTLTDAHSVSPLMRGRTPWRRLRQQHLFQIFSLFFLIFFILCSTDITMSLRGSKKSSP